MRDNEDNLLISHGDLMAQINEIFAAMRDAIDQQQNALEAVDRKAEEIAEMTRTLTQKVSQLTDKESEIRGESRFLPQPSREVSYFKYTPKRGNCELKKSYKSDSTVGCGPISHSYAL